MTLLTETNKITHLGDGSTVEFSYNFRIDDESDVHVYLDDVEQLSGWTVNGIGEDSGGAVTFSVAPANGVQVLIKRVVDITQEVDYQPYDPFPAETHEDALDKLTMQNQQQQEELDRAFKLLDTIDPGDVDPTFPTPEALKGIRWNAAADAFENTDLILIDGDFVSNPADALLLGTPTSGKTWSVTATGDFIPLADGSYDIGSITYAVQNIYVDNIVAAAITLTSLTVGTIYQGDSSYHYFGGSQQAYIRCSGDLLYIVNTVSNIYISTTLASNIFLATNSTNRWIVNSSGHLTPGAATTYNIGQASLPVQNIYQGDNGYHYFGDSQDARIYSSGSNLYIYVDSGSISFQWAGVSYWVMESGGPIRPSGSNPNANLGSTVLPLKHIYQGNAQYHYFGDTQEGRVYYASSSFRMDCTSGYLYIRNTDATGVIYFSTDSTNRWYIAATGYLIPVNANAYDIGVASLPVRHFYQGDNCYHYFGDGQDASIYHTGATFWIHNTLGALRIRNTDATGGIFFYTNSTLWWQVTVAGHFTPYVTKVSHLGSTSALILNIYQGDSCYHYFGDSQDGYIYFSGTNFVIDTINGSVLLRSMNATGAIGFYTNSTYRWSVNVNGHIVPQTTNTYNIGLSTLCVKNIYQGDSGYHYFGDSQDAYIVHNGTNFFISSSTGGIFLHTNGLARWFVDQTTGHFWPNATNTYDIGSATLEVREIFCVTLTESSDIRVKNILGESLGLDFINKLNPVSYTRTDIGTKEVKQGLVSQEVEAVLESLGLKPIDFAGLRYDEVEDRYGLAYTQFIAPLIKAVQELKAEVDELKLAA